MSQLLRCACGGKFWTPPQSQATSYQCPHCGSLCDLSRAKTALPPMAMVGAEPPLVASPIRPVPLPTVEIDYSASVSTSLVSPISKPRSSPPLWLYAGGGSAVLFVVVLATLLNSGSSQAPARKFAAKVPVESRPVTTAAARSTVPPTPPRTKNASAPIEPTPTTTPISNPQPIPEPAVPPLPAAAVPQPSIPVTQPSPLPPWVNALVQTHCLACHDAKKQEGGLRMDQLVLQPFGDESLRQWSEVLQRLSNQDMPPPDKSLLASSDRDRWTAWLRAEMQLLADRAPARPTMRRLNRAEYINSVQALTGMLLAPENVVDDVISSGFDTDAAELNLSPALLQRYVEIARRIAIELRNSKAKLPDQSIALFGNSASLDSPLQVEEEAQHRLRPFATTAFRRPADEAKLKRLVQIVGQKVAAGQTFDDGMQLAVQAVLCSPQFLLITDLENPQDDFALASKLSYFLWSGPPDKPLLELAQKNELRASLRGQVTRMLLDPKSRGLADNFASQWLGTRELGVMQPDEEVFPQYSPLVEASLREETHLFFDYLLRQNLSIERFLDADFTFVNEPLAALYGIPNIKGNVFRKVTLKPTQHRGGLLTQGSMLTITSDGVRSSPVIRGVWILENILGDPPSPPPADVPDLETDTRGTKSIREELERHRHVESCNSCHRKIDPLGFALENYDAIGQWRTHYPTATPPLLPVDNKGELPDGTTVTGVAQLKRVLLERKSEFARCLAEKLLAYGCSRKLDLQDDATVEQIVEAAAADGYRFQAIVQAIVHSPAFLGGK